MVLSLANKRFNVSQAMYSRYVCIPFTMLHKPQAAFFALMHEANMQAEVMIICKCLTAKKTISSKAAIWLIGRLGQDICLVWPAYCFFSLLHQYFACRNHFGTGFSTFHPIRFRGTFYLRRVSNIESNSQMPKHKLTKLDQARGQRKALRSAKTPEWLKPSIRRYLRKIEAEAKKE